MKVLFLTIGRLVDINAPGIYTDLLRKFRREGHDVYIACSREKKYNLPTEYRDEDGFHFLRVRIGNITQCSIIEKGISTVLVQHDYISAIRSGQTQPPIRLVIAIENVGHERSIDNSPARTPDTRGFMPVLPDATIRTRCRYAPGRRALHAPATSHAAGTRPGPLPCSHNLLIFPTCKLHTVNVFYYLLAYFCLFSLDLYDKDKNCG